MVRASVESIESLPTLSEVLARSQAERSMTATGDPKLLPQVAWEVQRQWQGAIAAIGQMLGQIVEEPSTQRPVGLILSNSVAMLAQASLLGRLAAWNFTTTGRHIHSLPSHRLSDGAESVLHGDRTGTIVLGDGDPMEVEQFCLVLTHQFTLVAARGIDPVGMPAFQFSFDPETVKKAWNCLRGRIVRAEQPGALKQLDRLVGEFAIVAPHYKTVTRFTRLLLDNLPLPDAPTAIERPRRLEPISAAQHHTRSPHVRFASHCDSRPVAESTKANPTPSPEAESTPPDIELLQAIAHEVRTPLSTIRTLTRLLLKQRDLAPKVVKWLDAIDRECSEQIERFGLIFKAVELETSQVRRDRVHLTRTCLERVVSSCIPRWEKQASRRSLKLDVKLPPTMPQVVSDPTMLDRVLTGTVDNFTSSVPAGSHVTVQIALAGDRLKLQLKARGKSVGCSDRTSSLKSIGKLLMFQPETGNLSLNLSVTKNLFQALGGKLIVRNRPQHGEELTIFLPLE